MARHTHSSLIKCSNCGKLLQDTREDILTCRYCGKKTRREGTEKDTEEMKKRVTIMNLNTDMRHQGKIRLISIIEAVVFIITIAILQLFVNTNAILMVVLFVIAVVWGIWAYIADKKIKKMQNRLFDLGGGRHLLQMTQ